MTRSRSIPRLLRELASVLVATAAGVHAEPTLEWRNPIPQGNGLWGVAFESTTVGYAVGVRGTVLRTTDGGATWADLSDRDTLDETLREVEVVAPGVLVVASDAGRILRSTDGGESWMEIDQPATERLREMAFVDGVLTVLGELSQVIRSTDGGLTWSHLTSPGGTGLKGQYWFDPLHGIVVGNQLARETVDGGVTWTDLPGGAASTTFCEAIDFVGDEGILVGEFSTWRTHDGGASWENVHQFSDPIYQRRAFIEDANTTTVFIDTEGAAIARTNDDGETWTYPVTRRDVTGFNDAVRHPAGGFVTVSTEGDVFRGTADALTWTNATLVPDDGTRIVVDAIGARPDGTLFASGYAPTSYPSRWLRSDDLGETWVVDPHAPPSRWIMTIHFADDDVGLAAGYRPGGVQVDRTFDGGLTWEGHDLQSSGGFVTGLARVGDVVLASVVREGTGVVERSTDGGVTWSVTAAGAERMECVGSAGDVVYAGGGSSFGSVVWRSGDAGATWQAVAGTGLPGGLVFEMAVVDASTVLVAAEGSPNGIYRTTDEGTTWSLVTAGWFRELDADGPAMATGGFSSEPFRVSADAGLTWTAVRIPYAHGPQAILVRGDRVVVGSLGSSLLVGEIPEVVAVGEGAIADHPRLGLAARAAGAGATVRLKVPTAGEVRVDVHDVTGRRVRELHAGPLGPGVHVLTWDGTASDGGRVATGVYWIQARSEYGEAGDRVILLR